MLHSQIKLMSICKTSVSKVLHKTQHFICRLVVNNMLYANFSS